MRGLMLGLSLGGLIALAGACEDDNPLSPESVTSVEITTAPPVLEAGSSVQLVFEIRDADGDLIEPESLTIDFSSSIATVATVSETGLVTSLGTGTTTITIEVGLVSDTVTVTVVPEISSLEFVGATQNLIISETFGLDVIALDMAGDLVADPVLTFTSSDAGVASVDENGNVTGVSAGTVTIEVTGGGESDTIEVVVFAASVQGIGFSLGNSFTVQAGDELVIDNEAQPLGFSSFVVTTFPSGANAPDAALEFTSTDASVVTVDAAGLLVAHAAGEAFITVTSPDVPGSATMRLKVIEAGSVDVFEMTPETATLQIPFFPEEQAPVMLLLNIEVDGEEIRDFLPSFASSDETVAVVISDGGPIDARRIGAWVVGVAAGMVTITAETGALTAESVITVLDVN
ncbi:MAG TPA: Ig-like domain-containing protein [Gemmatimonadota bacterium]|nr:Ig-like domain-containing protein [Gemmatimonadota bacterium]